MPGHRDAFADVVGKPAELLIGYQFCSRPGCVVTPVRVAAGTGMRAVISNRGHARNQPRCRLTRLVYPVAAALPAAPVPAALHAEAIDPSGFKPYRRSLSASSGRYQIPAFGSPYMCNGKLDAREGT